MLRQTIPFWLRGYKEYGGWQWQERFRAKFGQSDNQQNRQIGRSEFDVEIDNAGDINMIRPQIQKDLRIISDQAFDIYDPQPYGGRVTFFRASCIRVGHALQYEFDPLRGWGQLAQGGVDLRFVQGTHVGILDKPYVTHLASQLTQAIAEAQEANQQATAVPASAAA